MRGVYDVRGEAVDLFPDLSVRVLRPDVAAVGEHGQREAEEHEVEFPVEDDHPFREAQLAERAPLFEGRQEHEVLGVVEDLLDFELVDSFEYHFDRDLQVLRDFLQALSVLRLEVFVFADDQVDEHELLLEVVQRLVEVLADDLELRVGCQVHDDGLEVRNDDRDEVEDLV